MMKRLRVVYAVAKKDFIQLIRYPMWYVSLIIWPLILPLIYILSAYGFAGPDKSGLGAFKAAAGTESFAGFIVVGTMAWMWVNQTMWSFGTYLREEQIRGTLESNWLCPIRKIDILTGGALISLVESIMTVVISIIEYRYIYNIHFTGNIFTWSLVFLIMIPGIYGLGALFASIILWIKEANAAVNVARGIMMIICGITFPITIMPCWMQYIAKAIPFTYGIEASRQIMVNGQGIAEAGFNILMCLLEGIVLMVFGRIAFMRTEKLVKNSGSLERF